MANSDSLLNVLVFTLSINLLMFFVAQGIISEGGNNPFDLSQNILNQFDKGNYTLPETTEVLPESNSGINPTTNSVFTDIFNSIKGFFIEKLGLGFIYGILSAPAVLLQVAGLPQALSWAITSFWYGFNLFIIIAFIWGR